MENPGLKAIIFLLAGLSGLTAEVPEALTWWHGVSCGACFAFALEYLCKWAKVS